MCIDQNVIHARDPPESHEDPTWRDTAIAHRVTTIVARRAAAGVESGARGVRADLPVVEPTLRHWARLPPVSRRC
jgi:hypothetical protein